MVMDCSIESSGDLVITRAGFHNKGVSAADRYDKVYMNEVDFLSDVRGCSPLQRSTCARRRATSVLIVVSLAFLVGRSCTPA